VSKSSRIGTHNRQYKTQPERERETERDMCIGAFLLSNEKNNMKITMDDSVKASERKRGSEREK
jgi:hypothetical protein